MRVLYAVFVVSIAVLLWVAGAIARTVRRHRHGEPPAGAALDSTGTEAQPAPGKESPDEL
jgi:hypothetical protein